MEKLEAALAKAREARRSTQFGFDDLTPGRTPRVIVPESWAMLPEIAITPEQARHWRLAALMGGKEATPYDMLRSRTIRIMKESKWRRLAITSPNASCGKTTVALNLALSLARQKDHRVMLIDLDLRRPNLQKILGYQPARSIHEILGGSTPMQDAFVGFGDNLVIGLNASAARHPAEVLHSEQSRAVLASIEAQWKPDIVLFDMSPMLASDDNVGFLGNVDCALLVAAAEGTSLQNIDVCEKELAQLTKVLGVVLNKCRYMDKGGDYGYEDYE